MTLPKDHNNFLVTKTKTLKYANYLTKNLK